MRTERELLLTAANAKVLELPTGLNAEHRTPHVMCNTDKSNQLELQSVRASGSNCCLWFRLAGVYVASVLSSGFLFVWPVVQPLFETEGVYAEVCVRRSTTNEVSHARTTCTEQDEKLSQIYLFGANVILAASWPVGIIFDVVGPRRTTVIGSIFSCAGALALFQATSEPLSYSCLLLPGVILSDIGSSMASFGLYGFLWHCHDKQGFLAGLANSTYSVSSLLPLMLLNWFPLQHALLVSALLASVSVVLNFGLVPTSEEFFGEAEHVMEHAYKAPGFNVCSVVRSCYWIFVSNCTDNTLFSISLLFLICSYQYYSSAMWPFLKRLLGSDAAAQQVTMAQSQVYGILGFFLSPCVGYITDGAGMKMLVLGITILIVTLAPLLFVPSVAVQIAASIIGTILGLLQGTYYTRWFALYAPPDAFGNYSGAVCTACGILSLVMQSTLQTICDSTFSGLNVFLVPLGGLQFFNASFAILFCCHYLGSSVLSVPHVHDGQGLYKPVNTDAESAEPSFG